MSFCQRQELRAEARLTQSQRLEIKTAILGLRLNLIGNVHGGEYRPYAQCPRCNRTLTPLEIISGFSDDPNDYTTICTYCAHRFPPFLRCGTNTSKIEVPFYCSTQVLPMLVGLEMMSPEEIQKNHPAIYHSVRVHYGNFRIAFQKIGIQYRFESVTNWKQKVNDFLGKLPDTIIAEVVDMPVRSIRSLRNSLMIPPFRARNIIE